MAGGTKFIKEINDQFLVCKICHNTYNDPKTLVCLHTFCSHCIQQHVDSEKERTSRFSLYNRYITCPLCRKKTEIPGGGVRRLPDNFLVSNLKDVVNKKHCAKKPSCEICQTVRSRSNQACSKCLECSKLLCKNCVDLHRKTKVTEQHSLFDIDDEKDTMCKVHPEEVVRFFCEPCEACVCVLCTFQEHRDHDVCSFSEGFSKNKSTLETLLTKCREREVDVQARLNTIHKWQSLKKETQENIRDLAISYTSQVRAMERTLLKKVETAFSGLEFVSFMQSKDWLQECLDNMKSTSKLTDVILKDKNLEMLLLKKEIKEKLTTLIESKLPPTPADMMTGLKFIPGTVDLGTVSLPNEDNETEGTTIKCADTQTESVQTDQSFTTMGYNVTQPILDRSRTSQTDEQKIQTLNKEVFTLPVETREKGIDVYSVDVKSRGTFTERTVYLSAKCQTDKLITYDKECAVSLEYDTDSKKPSVVSCGTQTTIEVPYRYVKRLNGDPKDESGSCNQTKFPSDEIQGPISNRGVQTVISENNPLHKPTRTTSIMTDSVKHFEKLDSSAHSFSEDFDRMCLTCESCQQPFLHDIHSKKSKTANVIGTRSIGIDPIVWRETESDLTTACPNLNNTCKQADKSTSTHFVEFSSVESQTPIKEFKSKSSGRLIRYSSLGTCTHDDLLTQSSDSATNTTSVRLSHTGTSATVDSVDACTQAMHPYLIPGMLSVSPVLTHSLSSVLKGAVNASSLQEKANAPPKLLSVDCFNGAGKPLVDSSTPSSSVIPREMNTHKAPSVSDRWTCTDVKQTTDTSTATNKVFTQEKGVFTRTETLDQSTNTPILEYRECDSEAFVTTSDNETLTDKTLYSDAQTSSELTFSDSITWIGHQSQEDVNTMKDKTRLKDAELQVRPVMFNKRTNTFNDTDSSDSFTNRDRPVDFSPMLTRSLPESILSLPSGPLSKHYSEISTSTPTVEKGTMSSPIRTCDQSTMALSVLSSDHFPTVSTQTDGYAGIPTNTWPQLDDDLSYDEKATSTESLVYMGLLSHMDNIDELFFVPNVTLETVSSATSLSDVSMETERVEMLDQEMCTETINLYDCSTQTNMTFKPDVQLPVIGEYPSITFGLNTMSTTTTSTNTDSFQASGRESSSPSTYCLSKSTMTYYIEKLEKSTNTARRTSRYDFGPVSTSDIGISTDSLTQEDKCTMTTNGEFKDSSVSTESVFLDEKMAECIVKLKNVSDRLHSPTQKNPPKPLFPQKSQLARQKIPGLEEMLLKPPSPSRISTDKDNNAQNLSEEDRKRQVQELILQSQQVALKPQTTRSRKNQPITTLKNKPSDRLAAIEEEHYKSRSLPRQFSEREQLTGVKMGRNAVNPSRLPLLRYNSAPGRIATVPPQKLNILPRSPVRISPVPTKIPSPAKAQEKMPQQPQHSSVVQERRNSGHAPTLPAISESRTSSSCSSCSTVSRSSVETSSGTVSSDVTPNQLTKKPLAASDSSSSTWSFQSASDVSKTHKKSNLPNFMQRLLPKKKKEPPNNEQALPAPCMSPKFASKKNPEPTKTPLSPKKSRPFVYMRQRIFSIQHDGESAKSPKQKKKGKSKSKTDINSSHGVRETKGNNSHDKTPPPTISGR